MSKPWLCGPLYIHGMSLLWSQCLNDNNWTSMSWWHNRTINGHKMSQWRKMTPKSPECHCQNKIKRKSIRKKPHCSKNNSTCHFSVASVVAHFRANANAKNTNLFIKTYVFLVISVRKIIQIELIYTVIKRRNTKRKPLNTHTCANFATKYSLNLHMRNI